jgi:hypothetical protein
MSVAGPSLNDTLAGREVNLGFAGVFDGDYLAGGAEDAAARG